MRISDWSSDVCSSDLITSFGEETVTAYEGGFKSDLFDRRVRANFAGFYSRYKDVQKPAFQASTCQGTPPVCSPSFVFANVGNARIWGLEGEQIGRASCRERVCQYV